MDALTDFERNSLSALLVGDDPVLAILRDQAAVASVLSRENTAVGFFTEIAVPQGAARPPGGPSFNLGDVFGTTEGLKDGFGLVLHVDDGVIQTLEGYAFEDHWPDALANVTYRYASPEGRDFNDVRNLIYGDKAG